jgi:serine/threonine-protein kinase
MQRAPRGRWFGSYELVRLLARGGMAEVYEARRSGARGFSKRVAIKCILPQLVHDERLVQMFCNEATTLAALDHPNLVQVVDFGEHEGEPYMALEYIEGISCADLIAGVAARRRCVELGPALHIASEVLDALAYVHNARSERGLPLGIVHRDVAPENILLGRSGEVKLADFGIVRGAFIPPQTEPGELKGKIGYVSPEQAMGQLADARSDLFSLAVVVTELLIARPLFAGQSDLQILSSLCAGDVSALAIHGRHVPADVQALLRRGLEQDVERRYPDAASFKAAVDAAMRWHGVSIGAHGLAAYLLDVGLVRVHSTIRPSLRAQAGSAASVSASPIPAERVTVPDAVRAQIFENPRVSIPEDVRVTILEDAPRASSVSYRIRRASGTIVGPIPLAILLEMVATGRVGVDTFVSRNGGPFIAVASLHELARLAARPAYRFNDPIELYATERRAVDRVSLPRYLYGLVLQQRTGLLCARNEVEQTRVFLSDGVPLCSASTRSDALLGALLVARGRLPALDLARELEAGWRSGRRLGEQLVSCGAIQESELGPLLAEQLDRRIVALCGMPHGELLFVDGAPHGEPPRASSGEPLGPVTRAVLSAYSPAEIFRILQRAWAIPLRPTPAYAALCERLGLPAAEQRALDRAQQRPLRELLGTRGDVQSAADRVMLRAVFVGVSSGALRFRRAS